MLRLHVGEERPRRLPLGGVGVHEQAAAGPQGQPGGPALQEAAAAVQQHGPPGLGLQDQGQGEGLRHHVAPAGRLGRIQRTGGPGGGGRGWVVWLGSFMNQKHFESIFWVRGGE